MLAWMINRFITIKAEKHLITDVFNYRGDISARSAFQNGVTGRTKMENKETVKFLIHVIIIKRLIDHGVY